MSESKKFQSIAQFLQEQGKSQKVTIKEGKVSVSGEIVRWSKEEDGVLLDLLKRRTHAAIRRRLWDLLNSKKGKPNEKLK